MRSLFVIFLVIVLSGHSLLKLGLVAWYEVNKDYVSEVLCINKDKPEMNCHGKCYLGKQLKKAGGTESPADKSKPDRQKEVQVTDLLLTSAISFRHLFELSTVDVFTGRYIHNKGILFMPSIFHPPC